jgi:hypothetical protein
MTKETLAQAEEVRKKKKNRINMDRKIHPHTPHPPMCTHTQSTTQTTSMPKVLHSPPEKKRIEIKRT